MRLFVRFFVTISAVSFSQSLNSELSRHFGSKRINPMFLTCHQYVDPKTKHIMRATVVSDLATGVYVVATITFSLKTRESVHITKRTFEVTHRPYIGTVDTQRIETEDQAKFFVHYVNGRTVAAQELKTTLTRTVNGDHPEY